MSGYVLSDLGFCPSLAFTCPACASRNVAVVAEAKIRRESVTKSELDTRLGLMLLLPRLVTCEACSRRFRPIVASE